MISYLHIGRSSLLILGIVLTLGTGAFLAGRQLSFLGTAQADDPSQRELLTPDATPWYWPLLEEEDSKPRPDGTFNGILVSERFERTVAGCTDQNAELGDVSRAYGSALDPRPGYLPEGTQLVDSESMMCGSIEAWTRLDYEIPIAEGVSKYGGILTIYRSRQEGASLDVSAESLESKTILGANAVVVPPLTDDGFGRSAIVIEEPFGVTVVKASGITRDELLRIAEAITSGGGA